METNEKQQIRAIVKLLHGFTSKLIRKITLDITANLIEDTPVDTGWAQSNWVPRFGTEFSKPDGTRESVSKAAQQQGIALIAATYSLDDGFIWITNNVPYIVNLNEGSSKKAPAGYVQAAILRGIQQGVRGL